MTSATGPDVDVVVVGGGIGGLGNALALARGGLRVRVLEQAAQFGEVGAGLQLAPNATRVLRAWGVLDEVVAHGVLPRRLVMRDAMTGHELTHLDVPVVEQRYGAPYVVIHRSDLHTILFEACRRAGVDLVTGAAVEDVQNVADGAVAVSGGRRDEGRVVVAADGLGSGLRRRISDDEPVSSAYVAYRGAMPLAEFAGSGALALDEVVIYIGPHRHFVQYPLRRGEAFNQVAVFRSPKALAGLPEWGTPDELDDAFAGSCDQVRAGLANLWRDRWWRMYDRDPIPEWVDGRLTLTGDAAHPMLQYLAQGACQAIEDAECLATMIDRATTIDRATMIDRATTIGGATAGGRTDWDAALRGYAAARTARTARVQLVAREWGDLWHCDGLLRAVRNTHLTDRDPADFRHVDWLYGEHPA